MSQWTPTAIANEPERERAHSSCSTIVVRRSAPLPPYFSSYSRPRKPSSPSRGQIDAEGQRVLMALASDDDLILRDPRRAGDDLVGLARVDEHAADLGDLVGAPAPAEHPRRRAPTRTARVVDDREIAGAEADHR